MNPATRGRKGMCLAHYKRERKHGDPLGGPQPLRNTQAREQFVDDALASSTDECIIWPDKWDRGAWYGSCRRGTVHVVVCEATHGPRPDGMHAAHSCGRSRCVNPRHIRWVTPKVNIGDDRRRHGTIPKRDAGQKGAKMTCAQVDAMIDAYRTGRFTQTELATLYGVTQGMISRLLIDAGIRKFRRKGKG